MGGFWTGGALLEGRDRKEWGGCVLFFTLKVTSSAVLKEKPKFSTDITTINLPALRVIITVFLDDY